MKEFIAFWKKDFINRLIVLVSVAIVTGAIFIVYVLLNMKSDSMFYSVFVPGEASGGVPTIAIASVSGATETPFVFVFPPTSLPDVETSILEPFTVTAEPTITGIVIGSTELFVPATVSVAPTIAPTPFLSTSLPTQLVVNAAACIPSTPSETGRVLDVIDGNTIKVMIDGKAYTVRYIGIDVPAYRPVPEYFGQESDFKNAEFVFAEQISLISDGQDKDELGRLLRYIKVGDIFVNYELIRQGFALANNSLHACADVFESAEKSASQAGVGIWMPTPAPP